MKLTPKQLSSLKEKPLPYSGFEAFCLSNMIPMPNREWRFGNKRRWRFDFAWIMAKVALEVEGGVWSGGRHTRGSGFLRDMEKYNAATMAGWRVIRCTPQTLLTTETATMLRVLLA